MLLEFFDESPDWVFQKKIEIARKVGLNVAQVKKWNYDEKKRRSMPYKMTAKKQLCI